MQFVINTPAMGLPYNVITVCCGGTAVLRRRYLIGIDKPPVEHKKYITKKVTRHGVCAIAPVEHKKYITKKVTRHWACAIAPVEHKKVYNQKNN